MTNPGSLILLIEDDPAIRRFLRTVLPANGYRLVEAETGAEGMRLASQQVPDLVLLDLGLPDMEGLAVTQQLRAWTNVPIVILSARDQETEKVEALDAGADDYLTKPVGLAELLARLRVALRHGSRLVPSEDQSFTCGPLRLDPSRRQVFLDERELHLTPIEYKLLTALAEAGGRVVTHKQLLLAVWGPHSSQHREYLRVYMTYLRRKLDPGPGNPPLIATETGVGYRLRCDEA